MSKVILDNNLKKKIPNILSFGRILLVPMFVFLLIEPNEATTFWALVIFVIASLTDWLDGYLARVFEAQSILGKLLDPLADKILTMAALVMLAAYPLEPRIPAWMVVFLLAREFLVSGLRSVAAVKGIVVSASRLAKYKTAVMMISIVFLLVRETHTFFGYSVDFFSVGMITLWLAFLLSISSGISYGISLKKVFLE